MSAKPIYGLSKLLQNCCCDVGQTKLVPISVPTATPGAPPFQTSVPASSPLIPLVALLNLLPTLSNVVAKFFDSFQGVAQVIGTMTMRAVVSTPVFMRLRWIEEHPNTKFDKTNPSHLDDIKFLYNIYNKNWHTDPLFKAIGAV